jgi:NAD(P)-dependent dehydrogenase (short-subunit alcohol dehydrogenase family)
MSNAVVLITGGLTGIGRAAAVAFARKGAKVVVAGRRDEAGKALVKELRAFGSEAEFINADVRREDDVRNLVDRTIARASVALTSPSTTRAPKDTPQPIVMTIYNVMREVPGTPEGRARLAASGIEAVSMTTDEFAAFVRSEVTKWAKLVETSGATAD